MTLPLDLTDPRQDRDVPSGTSVGAAGEAPAPTLTTPVLTVIAHGTPGPQGSKSGWLAPNGTDVLMRESSKKVKPWRRVVRETAQRTLPADWALLDDALELEMVFTLHRGKTVKRAHPTVYPDLSKLARSTEDALTGVVWTDDARIVRYRNLAKHYPLDGNDALTYPGVVIRVYRIGEK